MEVIKSYYTTIEGPYWLVLTITNPETSLFYKMFGVDLFGDYSSRLKQPFKQ